MSKSSRTKKQQKRLQEKRQRRASQKALYQKWAAEGAAKGSKRSLRARQALKKPRSRTHPRHPCGNPGCRACYTNL